MGIFDKFKSGFKKSASAFTNGLRDIVVKKEIDDKTLDRIEEYLIQSDVGVVAASEIKEIISDSKIDPKKDIADEITIILKEYIISLMKPLENDHFFKKKEKINATLVSGVNGVGKTTTIGKIGKILKENGNKVMFAASDTFRAAAIEQLDNWAKKIDVQITKSVQNSDPASVAYKAIEEAIKNDFKGVISMADLIVFAGSVGVEMAARQIGRDITVPFAQGRGDATQEQTDLESFGYLEPLADGFRNYKKSGLDVADEDLLIDRANLLKLSIPEMTVLIGGLRVMGCNFDGSDYGVFTDNVGSLTNDFFLNILDFTYTWSAKDDNDSIFVGRDRLTGVQKFQGTRADLIFGSNTELRAVCEVYGADDGQEAFMNDFINAWVKVMNLDRYDLQ